jgi:beta-glucosidase
VTATVKNTSSRSGPATLELYLASPAAAHEPPKQLKGYSNVELAPGQSKLVTFRLSSADLAYYDANSSRFTVAPGRYTALVGTSSAELSHAASFEVGP